MQVSHFANQRLGALVPLQSSHNAHASSPGCYVSSRGLHDFTHRVPRHNYARANREVCARAHAAPNPGEQDRVNAQPEAEVTSAAREWDSWTSRLVSGATAVFLVLLVPQIVMNAKNMMHGDYAALTAIAWVVRLLT